MTDRIIRVVFSIAFVALLFIVFYAGSFTTSFDTNMCYSEVLTHIRNEIESTNEENLEQLQDLLAGMQLNGYESVCSQIKSSINM